MLEICSCSRYIINIYLFIYSLLIKLLTRQKQSSSYFIKTYYFILTIQGQSTCAIFSF